MQLLWSHFRFVISRNRNENLERKFSRWQHSVGDSNEPNWREREKWDFVECRTRLLENGMNSCAIRSINIKLAETRRLHLHTHTHEHITHISIYSVRLFGAIVSTHNISYVANISCVVAGELDTSTCCRTRLHSHRHKSQINEFSASRNEIVETNYECKHYSCSSRACGADARTHTHSDRRQRWWQWRQLRSIRRLFKSQLTNELCVWICGADVWWFTRTANSDKKTKIETFFFFLEFDSFVRLLEIAMTYSLPSWWIGGGGRFSSSTFCFIYWICADFVY